MQRPHYLTSLCDTFFRVLTAMVITVKLYLTGHVSITHVLSHTAGHAHALSPVSHLMEGPPDFPGPHLMEGPPDFPIHTWSRAFSTIVIAL